jgi:glucose-6-phosphate 1-dehydrogenase
MPGPEQVLIRLDYDLTNTGEEMIRAIYHLRFANRFIEPLLNREHVESISVVMKEKFGAEGRGGYFDEFGMIRDVGQNRECAWSMLQDVARMTGCVDAEIRRPLASHFNLDHGSS